MPSSTTTIAALTAAALLAYGATRLSKRGPADLNDLDSLDEDDFITPDDVAAIFDKLFLQMQQVVLQLSQQVQQIQMAGQVIPEKQLRQLLKSEFERALGQLQPGVLEENDVDEDCFEEATWEFLESPEKYPKVKRAVERFQALYESVSGEEVKGWHPKKKEKAGPPKGILKKEMSPEELVEAATVYFDAITEKMVEIANAYKSRGRDLKNPQISQQYQMEASTDANEAAEEKLEKMGVSMSDFRSAIDRHSRIPSVGQSLGMLQLKQQQELMAAGVPMM